MKTEEENILTNDNQNKLSLNPIISYNHNYNELKKINSSINIINTSGSQPIVIFKKISKSLTHPLNITKIKKSNNKVNDNIIRKKMDKYKSILSFHNQQFSNANTHMIKNDKNSKNIKTMRNHIIKKNLDKNIKEKKAKSKEKTQIYERNDKLKYTKKKITKKNNFKEINKKERNDMPKENNTKESHSQEHFQRKNKIAINNFISKSSNEIKYLKNKILNNNAQNYNINIQQNQSNIKFKIKKDNKNKINEESKIAEQTEQENKKSEYIKALIKNGVSNVSKKFKIVKPTKKEILNRKKKEYLLENGIIGNGFIEKNINHSKKIENIYSINNISEIKPIRKKNIATKNCLKKPKNLNVSKSNSKFISFLNTNSNINITNTNNNYIDSTNTNLITTNVNQETHPSNKNHKKRIILKPQINQFEFLNRIQQEQKKLYTQNNKMTEKNLETNENESKLSDSFRHKNKIKNLNLNIKKFENATKHLNIKIHSVKSSKYSQIKGDKNKKLPEEIENDEFPFSHRKSYRSPQEIMKYLKEKRIENKKEEENTEKEKQLKAYVTFQNLMNLRKKSENSINIIKIEPKINSNKIRKESNKEHLKGRKEPNEYYVGTESSKNNSTFIDKKEYYISILESKNFVNNTRISRLEDEKENNIINNKVENIISFEIGDNEKSKEKIKKYKSINNKILRKKLNRGNSLGFFENKKNLDELYISINKANKIFSEENLNKFKNDLLKATIDVNNSIEEAKINISQNKIIKDSINKNENININSNSNKTPKIKKENINYVKSSSINMINNRNKLEEKLNISNNKQKNLLSYSISFNNLTKRIFHDKIEKNYSHTYSKLIDKRKIFKKRMEYNNIIKLINIIKSTLIKKYFSFLYEKLYCIIKKKNFLIAFNCLIIISKINAFRTIEKYVKYLEYYEAFKELFRPFLHNRFKIFVINCYEIRIKKFIFILEIFFKYKAMNKLFIYCERDFKREIINFLILTIQKPFYDYFMEKLLIFNKLGGVFYYEDNNIFNSQFNLEGNIQTKNIFLIKNQNINIQENELYNLENSDNKDKLKILAEVKNPEKISEDLTDIIIKNIINSELKLFSPLENIIPQKSFKYDLLPKSQNNSLNNSYISSSCASLDQISLFSNNSNSYLNESDLSQMSYYSVFNKTIRDKKRQQAINFYNKKIGPKLIELICEEIKKNYYRIIKNIETPLRTNFEEIVVALQLKDNEKLKQNYRILKVNEEIKDIFNREKILKKFEKINKKIRIKYNQNNISENFDLFLNLNILDTTMELINKERLYGVIGEPFEFNSPRTRCIGYKYEKNNSKKLIDYVYNNLIDYLNHPIFLIKDNIVNNDEKNIIKYFKKDLEENEEQWQDMEIVETQSKLEVTELILDQLYNEIIEILEHVQLSRKRPELYQEKSIYACEDIPKLSFQQTTTENEYIADIIGKI